MGTLMEGFESVLCLCPSSRLSLASLVLSTWTNVSRYVLTEDAATASESYSAVLVMDRFVTRDLVERLSRTRPVIVLAWNGLFEIERYRTLLAGLRVIFMGTDETLEGASDIAYVPMINGGCSFRRWTELYRSKRQFRVVGSARYRGRWLRTRVLSLRPISVLISAAGALKRPVLLEKTLRSGVARDKLVWAGNCYLDYADIGLAGADQTFLEEGIAAVKALPGETDRLRATMDLITTWEARGAKSHQRFYVSNTLLRWGVLAFLSSTVRPSTWFFGRDNLGLGLELELYVHNLVPSERIAFLEFGGKTSATALYPRSLHLLARQYYVIPIPPHDAPGDVIGIAEELRRELSRHPRELFARIEKRRKALYRDLPDSSKLREVHARAWADFTSART